MKEVETHTHTHAHTHTNTEFLHDLYTCIKVLFKYYVCLMFHVPLGDDGHGVSLFVLVPSCAGGSILILLVTIVIMVLSDDYLITK